MLFFRKNKRQFSIRSHRNLFVAIFLFLVFGITGVISLILNAMAAEVPVPSVEIFSEHSSYPDDEPGSWKITKSAEWTDAEKARITFEVNSIPKTGNYKKLDVVMVIDASGSMRGDKLNQVKHDASDLVETLLSNPDNNIALVRFDNDAAILSGLTNNKTEILNLIDGLVATGGTNYYAGLLKAEEVLNGYVQQDDRELILLFLTDGYPNDQTPNEIAQYRTLKATYPYMTINGVQYEMGDTILQPIIDVSDKQFIADMSSLNNVLFNATVISNTYDDFVITDYINTTYWQLLEDAANATVTASHGVATIDATKQTVTWDMSGKYHSGQRAKLTIDIELNAVTLSAINNNSANNLLLPTNAHEEIKTKLEDAPDEDINSLNTPILKHSSDVIYHANAPVGCDVTDAIPETTSHSVFTTVEISDTILTCPGHKFIGWSIGTDDVVIINEDYFRMPGKDVHIFAIWAKPSISKSMDGTVHVRLPVTATFTNGRAFNTLAKRLAGEQQPEDQIIVNGNIKAIKRSRSLPSSVNTAEGSPNILSSADSEVPIYGWFDNDTLWYYADADIIYTNKSASEMFISFKALSDIDALSEWNTSKTAYFAHMFGHTNSLTNVDALSGWSLKSAQSLSYMFDYASGLSNINGLRSWNVGKIISLERMLSYTAITNIDALQNWDTSSAIYMSQMFAGDSYLENIDGAMWWNTKNVEYMDRMFYVTPKLTDIDGASYWNVRNVKSMSHMFHYSGLTSLSDISGWNTSNVENMSYMFCNNPNLTNINPILRSWNTQNVTNMANMFQNDTKVENVNLYYSDASALTNISNMLSGLTNLKSLSIYSWKTQNVTNMTDFLAGSVGNLETVYIENWNISSVTEFPALFRGAAKLHELTISEWDTNNATSLEYMFQGTSGLSYVSIADWHANNATSIAHMFEDSSLGNFYSNNWENNSLIDASYLFGNASQLTDIIIENWTAPNLKNISHMFENASNLHAFNGLGLANTSSLSDISHIFDGASSLEDISGLEEWQTDNVTDMSYMFHDATSLSDIMSIGRWNTENVENMEHMFDGAINIYDLLSINDWDVSSVTNMTGMFDGINQFVERPGWY